jgi:hypothetical protein
VHAVFNLNCYLLINIYFFKESFVVFLELKLPAFRKFPVHPYCKASRAYQISKVEVPNHWKWEKGKRRGYGPEN